MSQIRDPEPNQPFTWQDIRFVPKSPGHHEEARWEVEGYGEWIGTFVWKNGAQWGAKFPGGHYELAADVGTALRNAVGKAIDGHAHTIERLRSLYFRSW